MHLINSPSVNSNCAGWFQNSSYHIQQDGILDFPHEDLELMPGVKWGNYCKLYTPAFWKFLYASSEKANKAINHKLGETLVEEIAACMLGGYGMPSELGLLAFQRLKKRSLLVRGIRFEDIQAELSEPYLMKNGLVKKYRFVGQKSNYLYSFLNRSDLDQIPDSNDLSLREWLLTVKGIGPKTASWITRNWLHSEKVAILDVHILRAGKLIGFFDSIDNVSERYFELERKYITFCKALNVLPSFMDAIMWDYMKKTQKLALKALL